MTQHHHSCDSEGMINIIRCGAKGDGVTDDTEAIQSAINELAARGGGRIYFPFRPKGYRIARPARESVGGMPCRGQLYIPWTPELRPNIFLEGEMPCTLLHRYFAWYVNPDGSVNPTPNGRPAITFALPAPVNTFLFSDWDAPEERDPAARPWSLLTALEGVTFAGKFGPLKVSIANLEFRVKLDRDKMYPAMTAANLQNAEQLTVRDSQFCLDSNIGDAAARKVLQPSPVFTAGLIAPARQNDDVLLDNVSVQGFRYGFVFSEHVIANYLYAHNTETAVAFHDCPHLSHIHHLVAQLNQTVIGAPELPRLFGMPCSGKPIFVNIDSIDFEPGGPHMQPEVSVMKCGLYDPENRMRGRLLWHSGYPANRNFFPVQGGRHYSTERFDPEVDSGEPTQNQR